MRFLNKLFGRCNEDEIPPDELNHWVIAEAKNGETRVVCRLRTTRPAIGDIGAYVTGISIRWNFDGADSGMPASDVNAQQMAFEEAIEDLTMYNGHSFLMLVSTGLDYKEWLFYAKDRDAFMNRLNTALKRHPPYPLNIEFYDDPKWKIWNDFVGTMVRKLN